MTDGEKPKIVSLDFDFRPEASASGALLVQTELEAYLAFNTVHNRDGRWVDAGKTLLVFNRCWISQFGYSNDEAIEADALAPGVRNFAGICEVLNSRWVHSLAVANERIFPGSDWFAGARHPLCGPVSSRHVPLHC